MTPLQSAFGHIINVSIAASFLMLAVILLRPFLKRVPKWLVCILWGMVALRLVIPFSPESRWSLVPAWKVSVFQENEISAPNNGNQHGGIVAEASVDDEVLSRQHDQWEETDSEMKGQSDEGLTVEARMDESVITSSEAMLSTIFWGGLLTVGSGIWLAGILAMLAYATVGFVRLRSRVRTAVRFEAGAEVKVWMSDAIAEPFVLGIVRPSIYIPSIIEEGDLKCVLCHEQAHVKRRDYLWKPLGFLILCVYWFHPLCWISYLLFCKDVEVACDEKATKGFGKEERKQYCQTLLNLSQGKKDSLIGTVAFGENSAKSRVKAVLNYKKPSFLGILVGSLLCIALGVFFMTNPNGDPGSSWLASSTKLQRTDVVYDEDGNAREIYFDLKLRNSSKGIVLSGTILYEGSIYYDSKEAFKDKWEGDGDNLFFVPKNYALDVWKDYIQINPLDAKMDSYLLLITTAGETKTYYSEKPDFKFELEAGKEAKHYVGMGDPSIPDGQEDMENYITKSYEYGYPFVLDEVNLDVNADGKSDCIRLLENWYPIFNESDEPSYHPGGIHYPSIEFDVNGKKHSFIWNEPSYKSCLFALKNAKSSNLVVVTRDNGGTGMGNIGINVFMFSDNIYELALPSFKTAYGNAQGFPATAPYGDNYCLTVLVEDTGFSGRLSLPEKDFFDYSMYDDQGVCIDTKRAAEVGAICYAHVTDYHGQDALELYQPISGTAPMEHFGYLVSVVTWDAKGYKVLEQRVESEI